MLAMIEVPSFAEDLHECGQVLAAEIASKLDALGEAFIAEVGTNLLRLAPPAYVFIREGLFRFSCGGKVARLYSAGDLVLAGGFADLEDCALDSSVAARVTRFDRRAVLEKLCAEPELLEKWLALQEIEARIMQVLAAIQANEDIQPDVAFTSYEPDETIVSQGEHSGKIFELLGGRAAVFVDGVMVGEIKEGELFGEMSFLTGEPCAATVTASESCMVQGISKDDFERMAQCRPRLMVGLARTLAQRVSELNKKLSQT